MPEHHSLLAPKWTQVLRSRMSPPFHGLSASCVPSVQCLEENFIPSATAYFFGSNACASSTKRITGPLLPTNSTRITSAILHNLISSTILTSSPFLHSWHLLLGLKFLSNGSKNDTASVLLPSAALNTGPSPLKLSRPSVPLWLIIKPGT